MHRTFVSKLCTKNLIMDDEEINVNLAKDFFKSHEYGFAAMVNGEMKKTFDNVDDNKNNKISFSEFEIPLKTQRNEFNNLDDLKLSDILYKIAVSVEQNSNLFAQIDYAIRGINPTDVQYFDVSSIAACFRYYSNCCTEPKYRSYIEHEKAAIYLSDSMPLALLGWLIAPAFAFHCDVYIFCTPNMTAAVTLFVELCYKAGIPVPTLNMIPRPKNHSVFTKSSEYLNLRDTHGSQLIDLIYPKPYRGAIIISESADIDSAVDSIFEAAWTHNGMLPWSLKRVLVQESILEKFKSKLKLKLQMHELKKSSCGNLDDDTAKDVNDFVNRMAARGIKSLSLHKSFEGELLQNFVKPIIFVDNIPLNDEEIFFQREVVLPIVFLQSFRTTKEAISIVNNKPAVAVGVWCNKVTVGNEYLGINANHVWYNCYALFSTCSDVGWSAISSNDLDQHSKTEAIIESNSNSVIEKIAKMQTLWKTKLPEERAKAFLDIAKKLNYNFTLYINKQTEEYKINTERAKISLNSSIEFLKFAAAESLKPTSSCDVVNKTLHLKRKEPVGIVCVEPSHNSLHEFIMSVAEICHYGNGVIYGTRSPLIAELSKQLFEFGIPLAILDDVRLADVKYNAVQFIWSLPSFKHENDTENEDIQRLLDVVHRKDIMERRFTNTKSVWSTIGETFAN